MMRDDQKQLYSAIMAALIGLVGGAMLANVGILSTLIIIFAGIIVYTIVEKLLGRR